MIVAIPMSNVSVIVDTKYDSFVNASWVPSSTYSTLEKNSALFNQIRQDCEKLHEDNPNGTYFPEHLLCTSSSHVLSDNIQD